MQNPKHLNLLINLGGAVVGVIIIGYIVNSALNTEVEQPCSARYSTVTRFSLQGREGKPLTPIELQARAGLRDLGVIDNATVVPVEGGPSPEALQVKLRKLPGGADNSDTARNGIEFRWSPPGISGASAACLSYSVWLPGNFKFGEGGVLPGMVGGEPTSTGQRTINDRFSIAFEWDASGKPLLVGQTEAGERIRISGRGSTLPIDRWFKVEQEVILNDVDQTNGIARMWIDGALVLGDGNLPLRKDAKALLSGVLAVVGNRHVTTDAGVVRLSPLEVGWR